MDKLTELINAGPDQRYTMKAVVLSRFDDIVAARGLMRTWADIAAALGFEGRGKDLSGCFLRVDAAIKKGKLKVPQKTASRNPVVTRSQVAKRNDDEVETPTSVLSRITHI